jgi:SpoVK/Ycf46/Vps4 family AAA+-type ATPase
MSNAVCLQSTESSRSQICTADNEEFFINNFAYIDFLTIEVYLWVAAAYIDLQSITEIPGENSFLANLLILKGIKDAAALEREISRNAIKRQKMEEATASRGIVLNFKKLITDYRLNDLESKIFQLLLIAHINLEFSTVLDMAEIEFWQSNRGGEMEIGVILSLLCREYEMQFAGRSCFSIDRPLVKHELVELSSQYSGVLTTDVKLQERISRFCINDHNVYDTELLCIHSERTSVRLSQVVMDRQLKAELVHYVESFIDNSDKQTELNSAFGYGTGLTCLFYGFSGTGKTMLAHGLANHLGCQLFSVNIGALEHEDLTFEDAIKHIFREARLANGIVFLDECDDLLTDNSYMSRTFLIEIEKAECITILATNKTVSMDPAMDRRISLKIPFSLPGEQDRKNIWQALLPANMEYGSDVELAELAARYKFTGGLIKNTLLMAAGSAMIEQKATGSRIILSAAELHRAARYQAKSIFDLASIGSLYSPETRLNELPVRRIDRDRLSKIVELIPVLKQEKTGFSGLICSNNIQTGQECAEAVAAEAKLTVRRFSLSNLFKEGNSSEFNSQQIMDPFTQKSVSLLDFVFGRHPGQQEMLLLRDDAAVLENLLEGDRDKQPKADWQKFRRLMREFDGILFVVTTPLEENRIPVEFACHISLSHPAEDAQIQAWQNHFPGLSDDETVQLVEQYPLHIKEINLIARQSLIAARLEGYAEVELSGITAVVRRLLGVRSTPLLFGAKRGN